MKRDQALQTSFLYGANADYIESLQDSFADNASLDEGWRNFFAQLADNATEVARSARGPSWQRLGWPQVEHVGSELGSILERVRRAHKASGAELSSDEVLVACRDSVRALFLIRAYRARGHLQADLDPLKLDPP